MKKIVLFLTSLLILNCSVPYDGETRYMFSTTILDKNNNPIPNLKVSVNFYNGGYYDDLTGYFNVNEFDKIVQSTTDANGSIKLIFPFALERENISIKFENDNYSVYEIINIKKNNFTNYKLSEPPFVIYKVNETTNLFVDVLNTSQTKYVTKIDLIGLKSEPIKNYNLQQEPIEISPILSKYFNPVSNQNVILRYEITTVINGQNSFEVIEETISIEENPIHYEIIL